jgi:ribokinase
MSTGNNQSPNRYEALIATGGIGSGIFAALKGDHPLGREESRAVHFLNRRDYCKGHIITHYVNVLTPADFETLLIGKVGDDPAGARLLDEMLQVGIDVRFVRVSPGAETIYSVCFLYPDGSGGNLTSEDSASSQVSAEDILQAEGEFARFAGKGIALAAPEVPLLARKQLLEQASRFGFLRSGSFISAEIREAQAMGLFGLLDLVALNIDEAGMIAGQSLDEADAETVANKAIDRLSGKYPGLMISITAGKHGSWSWNRQQLHHLDAFPTRVVSTAGAGDAHLGGMIAGLACGLSLAHAQELGGLTAAMAVASPHTIAPEVNRLSLWACAQEAQLPLSAPVMALLQTEG